MEALTYSDARADLKSVLDRVVNDREPLTVTRSGAEAVVFVSLADWTAMEGLVCTKTGADVSASSADAIKSAERSYEVLCRVDAFTDYVTSVEADDPQGAVSLARAEHNKYDWKPRSTEEFDARVYVALDSNGGPIEETKSSDF